MPPRGSHTYRRRPPALSDLRRVFLSGIVSLAVLGACEFQAQPRQGPDQDPTASGDFATEIRDMLRASAASWNGGDLDGFLDDYWVSDDLTFSGPDGVTRGWEEVRSRYLQSYWAPGVQRDSLRFEGIEVTALGPEYALALGHYELYRPEEGEKVTGSGNFSLVLRRWQEGWRIIHDHTSPTPPEEGSGKGSAGGASRD